MIKTLLIANRGEIACRIMRTAKKMGIKTVAVFSTADENAMHVAMADESFCIGPPAARESYLDIAGIINAARESKADAIHPGYGFLSENAGFAKAVEKAGLIFIGAPANAMASMGDKSTSKKIMESVGIPLIPGFNDTGASDEELFMAAEKTGYPVLLKASAGGGGKGMRIVTEPSGFHDALSSARREALSAFGSDHMILERYIDQPRHVEVQIFFDKQGQGVYLFDRDCSLQRRYQKIIEEAPAPGLPDPVHEALGKVAIEAGKAVNYEGAGTVEFLVDRKHRFYFMEMNTRLQVEHPVTEMITGVDLVEWQIRIASGEPLPVTQQDLTSRGHAFEARLYAEEPAKSFAPATGYLQCLQWPEKRDYIRIETGVRSHDEVTPWYDPMIAKVVTWGENREQALNRLVQVLQHTCIAGVSTNRDFLIRLAGEEEIVRGNVHTALVEKHQHDLFSCDEAEMKQALVVATLYQWSKTPAFMRGWRMNAPFCIHGWWLHENRPCQVVIEKTDDYWNVHINREHTQNFVHYDRYSQNGIEEMVLHESEHREKRFSLIPDSSGITVVSSNATFRLSEFDCQTTMSQEDDAFLAPINGRVSSVHVTDGEKVETESLIMTIEAMKMEIRIKAPCPGIAKVFFKAGDTVRQGDLLFSCEGDE